MKRLTNKKGFTLVECIVAMGILMVLAMSLMLLLGSAAKTRNDNVALEHEVDRQVQEIVQGTDVTTEKYDEPIIFYNDSGVPIGQIPGNGGGVVADKKYQENEDIDVQVGRLEYDFGNMEAVPGSTTSAVPNPAPAVTTEQGSTQAGNYKVYGAADINGEINIEEKKAELDPTGKYYTVTWEVTFKANSGADEKAVKIIFPTGAAKIKWLDGSAYSVNCVTLLIGKYTERIAPHTGSYIDGGTGSTRYYTSFDNPIDVTATFTFEIPVAYRDGDAAQKIDGYKNPVNYFTGGGSGSKASVRINTEYVNGSPKS